MMISLRKLMAKTGETAVQPRFRAIQLLLQGIALHSVGLDESDYRSFREDLERMMESLDADPSDENILLVTGSANRALEEYNRRNVQRFRSQSAIFHDMVSMLSKTLLETGRASGEAATRLQQVERSIEQCTQSEEFLKLKTHLAESLRIIREEHHKHDRDLRRTLDELKRQATACSPKMAGAGAVEAAPDPATGLAPRSAAEEAIYQVRSSGDKWYAVICRLERFRPIQARFGAAVASQAMRALGEFLASRLESTDQLFSWDSSSIVALLNRAAPIEVVRRDMTALMSQRFDIEVRLDSREVLLPLRVAWSCLSVSGSTIDVPQKIEAFLSAHN